MITTLVALLLIMLSLRTRLARVTRVRALRAYLCTPPHYRSNFAAPMSAEEILQ